MTSHNGEETPDVDVAAMHAEQSMHQAEQDWLQAQERAKRRLTLAERLRLLREDNGFDLLFDNAFGGGNRA